MDSSIMRSNNSISADFDPFDSSHGGTGADMISGRRGESVQPFKAKMPLTSDPSVKQIKPSRQKQAQMVSSDTSGATS